ncbi:MAG: hypothetical protein M1820_001295 [Bogoriella megaspora]|nr:MAG: hypothetical protein M1820_001295 [Bogoriella megaspora]
MGPKRKTRFTDQATATSTPKSSSSSGRTKAPRSKKRSRLEKKKEKGQETLTQRDFVWRFPSIYTGETDEDEDYIPSTENPRKRKRSSPVLDKRKQQTLTQIDWMPCVRVSDEEDNLELTEDDEPMCFEDDGMDFSGRPCSDGNGKSTLRSLHFTRVTKPEKLPDTTQKTDARNSCQALDPATPSQVRLLEIPSSQTPVATPLSTIDSKCSRRRINRSTSRSPLKEISSNSRSILLQSPCKASSRPQMPLKRRTPRVRGLGSSAARKAIRIIDDSDPDDLEKEIPTPSKAIETQDWGIREVGYARDQALQISQLRTESQEVSTQLNRELSYFTQQPLLDLEESQRISLGYISSQSPPNPRSGGKGTSASQIMIQPSHSPSATNSKTSSQSVHPARDLMLTFSSPIERPMSRDSEGSNVVAESPLDVEQEAVTLSQLLPDSLMNFGLPPPPSSSQSSEFPQR